ncbi:hypothetical protein JJE66_04675 [Bradyrhizobium diazoefficiens]|uniref:hypothetical protein n=1 Tax=Bradyrhizobium diazoefficiens TaxID=1355477 RepID=UPI00190E058E|nr:hypothetical protein [Bradyrhizobium diazoefficiens]MBK3660545.1 hypothetical protein [Bradyrhizobium diazoefficiens]
MAEIYALFSGRDFIVRYVGETAGTREDRFREHLKYASGVLRQWFLEEWKQGYPIRCALLQRCNYGERFDTETLWINRFPTLLNERKHYRWCSLTAPIVPAIVKHRRRYRYNVAGFRGVHYDVQMDRYFVLIYTGRGGRWGSVEWARGDEVPGLTASQGGNIWFSDRTSALIARDKQRWWRSVQYLPDVQVEHDFEG